MHGSDSLNRHNIRTVAQSVPDGEYDFDKARSTSGTECATRRFNCASAAMSHQLDGMNNLEASHLDLTSYSDLCFISAFTLWPKR